MKILPPNNVGALKIVGPFDAYFCGFPISFGFIFFEG
jgi:hypothetical protein